jgi:hypothetical protein
MKVTIFGGTTQREKGEKGIQNSIIGKCARMCLIITNTFFTGDSVPRQPPQGTLSPVSPLAYGMKVCVRAYGASAFVSQSVGQLVEVSPLSSPPILTPTKNIIRTLFPHLNPMHLRRQVFQLHSIPSIKLKNRNQNRFFNTIAT